MKATNENRYYSSILSAHDMTTDSNSGSIDQLVGIVNLTEDTVLEFKLMVDPEADLFDSVNLQFELSVADSLVEYRQFSIRIAPSGSSSNGPASIIALSPKHKSTLPQEQESHAYGCVLLITSPHMSRSEFMLWQSLLNAAGLSKIEVRDFNSFIGEELSNTKKIRDHCQNSDTESVISPYRNSLVICTEYTPSNFPSKWLNRHFGVSSPETTRGGYVDSSALLLCKSTEDDDYASLRNSILSTSEVASAKYYASVQLSDYFYGTSAVGSTARQLEKAFLGGQGNKSRDLGLLLNSLALMNELACVDPFTENTKSGGSSLVAAKKRSKSMAALYARCQYGAYHCCSPTGTCFTQEPADQRITEILRACERSKPDFVTIAMDRTIEYTPDGLYWSYGDLTLRQFSIPRHCQLTLVNREDQVFHHMEEIDLKNLTSSADSKNNSCSTLEPPQTISLASRWCQVSH
ncbi:hypothetical protein Ciccas_012985 [Cichlidogyrus casuarinus]|uniref:Uncharacterized protein n=1 Tax=Cichlidogyrus casuarinus TaxID=1844966 RepID=A0ABD2PLS5_9PLAT